VIYLLDHPLLITQIQHEKYLPIKIIQKNLKVPRKLLERHRKYIIAVVEILKGDYPYLSEYLKDLKGGSK
jgi:RNA polymerase sigma factor